MGQFRTNNGVRQGCPLSPAKFNVSMAELETEMKKVQEGGIVVGYCEYFAFYTYEHTHETQTARDTCKFPLSSLYVSGELCRAAASDALLSLALFSLVLTK